MYLDMVNITLEYIIWIWIIWQRKAWASKRYNLKLRARSGYSLLNHLTRGTPSLENMTRVQRISSSHIRPWEITMRLSDSNKATVAISWAKARSTRAVEYYGAIHTVTVYWKRLQKTTFERSELGIMRRHSERYFRSIACKFKRDVVYHLCALNLLPAVTRRITTTVSNPVDGQRVNA